MITLNLEPQFKLTNEAFEELCRNNPELRLERTAEGKLIAMSPTGSESGRQNLGLSAQLWYWNQQTGLGVAFDSSSGFTLPKGAIRSPDVAWMENQRWEICHQNNVVVLRQFALILSLNCEMIPNCSKQNWKNTSITILN